MAKGLGWHPEDIKAALRKQFGPITDLSAAWGYHRSAISAAVTGRKRSSGVEMRIAQALKQSPHTLWPDRWTPEGVPRPRGRNATPTRPAAHRQIEEAA
jgi:Ner family transcriptional regulator